MYRVHRRDNDFSRFLGRIKEKYICLSNRSPTVPLRGRGGWGYVSRMYASPGCKHVFWRYCSRLLSRHERPLIAIYFHSLQYSGRSISNESLSFSYMPYMPYICVRMTSRRAVLPAVMNSYDLRLNESQLIKKQDYNCVWSVNTI